MTSLVLSAIGPDQPGLVETLASTVADHGGNWEESRMAHLRGEFAGIVRVSIASEKVADLRGALDAIEALEVTVKETSATDDTPDGETATLELIGSDRPGIVQQISRALADHQVNVEDLETECSSAPMSGETLFKASAQLELPKDLDLGGLQEDLEAIASDLMVDLKLVQE